MKWLIWVTWLLSGAVVRSQSVEVQQLVLNIEKLAQMKATYQSMIDGYRTLETGYRQVSSLAKGNFDLHREYIDGLLGVGTAVRQYHKVGAILRQQALLVSDYKTAYASVQSSGMLNAQELIRFRQMLTGIVNRSAELLDGLLLVVTPGQLRMNDEERLTAIDRVEKDMNALAAELTAEVNRQQALAAVRARRKRDVNAIKAFYGIKQ